MRSSDQDDRLDRQTRQLLKEIRSESDPNARLAAGFASDGTKGDAVSFSEILLSLVTGGPISKFIECLFGFLNRNRKLTVEVENPAGAKLKLSVDFIDREGIQRVTELVNELLRSEK